MNTLSIGEQMEITVTDFGFCADIEAWAKKTGHTVLKNEQQTDKVVVILQKNQQQSTSQPLVETKDGATMVVFSGDLDKALRSEEHTSELQSRFDLVCRPLLEKNRRGYTEASDQSYPS